MIDKNKIIVVKYKTEIIICMNGCKLIKPIDGLKDKTEDEIRDLFWNEIGGESVK